MTSSVVSNTCRITVIAASLRADLAVPAQITVAELLATLVSSLGAEIADEGASSGGWILQRAGEPPLDPGATLAGAQITDGAVLQLRTRSSQLPEVAFDDVLDAVATGVLTRTARWTMGQTKSATVTFAGVALFVALVTALTSGPGWIPAALVLGAGGVLLVGVAVALMRAFGERAAAIVAASFGIAFGAAGAATALGQHRQLFEFGAPQALLGAGAAVLLAAVCVLTVGVGVSGFVAVITLGLLTAIGTGVGTVTTLSPGATGSLMSALALAISPVLPILSFRMSRLPLPAIPTDSADLRRDTGRIDPAAILRQATLADHFLTGLVGGVALTIGGAAVLLATGNGSEQVLAVVLGLIALLRARLFTGRAQRSLLLVAGGVALVAVYVGVAIGTDGTARVTVLAVPAIVVAIGLLAFAARPGDRRQAPPLARFADIIEALLVLSVIPLAMGVLGVYGAIRTLVSSN